MSLWKIRYWGQKAEVTLSELRGAPGDLFDRVSRGLTVFVTRSGKTAAVVSPPPISNDVDCIVHSDGTWEGERPITLGYRP